MLQEGEAEQETHWRWEQAWRLPRNGVRWGGPGQKGDISAMCWGSGCGALEPGSSPSTGEALALLALGRLLAFAGGSPSTSGRDPEGMRPFLHFSNISSSADLSFLASQL